MSELEYLYLLPVAIQLPPLLLAATPHHCVFLLPPTVLLLHAVLERRSVIESDRY